MSVGIDQLNFYTPHYYVDLRELARARGVEPDKFTVGIGQDQQAVPPSSEDVVTMGAAAALGIDYDDDKLAMLIVGTESGIDASKASALEVQKLLRLSPRLRAFEIKEACYGGTAALMMARDYVVAHPDKQVLVIAADIARYGLASAGEVTQGAGAVALLVTSDPRILALEDDSAFYSESIMDFWRPNYQDTALVDGKYSSEQYLRFFAEVWSDYKKQTGRMLSDFAALTFHLPFTKMGLKALKTVLPEATPTQQAALEARYIASAAYSRRVGNLYTGSLYLSLLSILETAHDLSAGDRIGLFSYGSGAVGEFFSGTLVAGYADLLRTHAHADLLDSRAKLTIPEYEAVFSDAVPYNGADYTADPEYFSQRFRLVGVRQQQRLYEDLARF